MGHDFPPILYYSQFVPSLLGHLALLHALLKKDTNGKRVVFDWTPACQHVFEEVERDPVSPLMLMLVHYDPKLPIILAADASPVAVGAVISHRLPHGRELPISHASKTLTPTEGRYPQIEKEALALIFSVHKFHQYLWDRHFILQTEHKPLVKIFGSNKGPSTTSASRLQNYAIILMSHSFDIEYIQTDKFGHADGLSRLPLEDDGDFSRSKRVDATLGTVLPFFRIRHELAIARN